MPPFQISPALRGWSSLSVHTLKDQQCDFIYNLGTTASQVTMSWILDHDSSTNMATGHESILSQILPFLSLTTTLHCSLTKVDMKSTENIIVFYNLPQALPLLAVTTLFLKASLHFYSTCPSIQLLAKFLFFLPLFRPKWLTKCCVATFRIMSFSNQSQPWRKDAKNNLNMNIE